MAKEFKITSLRLADLEKELNYLKTTREREVAAMIAEARSSTAVSPRSRTSCPTPSSSRTKTRPAAGWVLAAP